VRDVVPLALPAIAAFAIVQFLLVCNDLLVAIGFSASLLRARPHGQRRQGLTMSPRRPVLALDVGGTSVKSAIVGPSGRLAGPPQRTPIDSTASADAVIDTLAGVVDALAPAAGPAIAGVAVAFPGPCDYERGVPGRHDDGKFAALAGVDLPGELRRRLGREHLPIGFCNDAEAAIVAEALYGAGRPFERVLGITLGAGLGACLVAGDAIVEACAAVVPGELYRRPFGAATADDVFSDRGLRARLGGADPASARDDDARRAFAAFGADLGAFLAPSTEILRADGVIVAGGIAAAFALFGPSLEAALPVAVRAGELRVAAGLIGAAHALNGAVRRVAEPQTTNVG
jgi:glucokinase